MCNYRPISIVCLVAKALEKEIQCQFLDYLFVHTFITPDQSAYLKRHSTPTCLHKVVDDWLSNMNVNIVYFLDLQNCFDTTNHDILLAKLRKYGVMNMELKWFEAYGP